jgi:NAD(P)-dependent dehydrogenase (short-subunit alcohol dehydrogenase family)
MFDLKNKIVVVTGAGGFLGSYFCETLISFGANVVAIDIDKKSLNNLKRSIKNSKLNLNKIFLIKCNILNESEIIKSTKKIIKKYKKIDVLINNATYRANKLKNFYKPFEDFNLKDWSQISRLNNDGTFLITKHISKQMIKKRSGSIIQIGSIYSHVAPNFEIYKDSFFKGNKINSPAVYSVNKFGLYGFTKYLSSYLGKYNIRVNCLSPGGIEQGHTLKFKKNYSSNVPLNRMGKIDDLKGMIILLSSSESSFITGQNILIDGGLSCW